MKRLIAIGDDSERIALDEELLKLAGLDCGDEVSVTVSSEGVVTLRPVRRRRAAPEEVSKVVRSTMEKYSRTLKKLA